MVTVCRIYIKVIIVCKTNLNYNILMRICTVCGESKTDEDFFYRNKRAEKLHSQCKECYALKRRKIWHTHYHKYGSKYRERAIVRNRKIKNNLKKIMFDYLSDKSCLQCGVNDPRVLEFDHIKPSTKSFSIAQAINNTQKWENILLEINKCQILCANCHKIKTAEEQDWYKHISIAKT